MTRCLSRRHMAMAYSATTVLPADVCADTSTDWLRSRHAMDSRWKGSRVKGYSCAAHTQTRKHHKGTGKARQGRRGPHLGRFHSRIVRGQRRRIRGHAHNRHLRPHGSHDRLIVPHVCRIHFQGRGGDGRGRRGVGRFPATSGGRGHGGCHSAYHRLSHDTFSFPSFLSPVRGRQRCAGALGRVKDAKQIAVHNSPRFHGSSSADVRALLHVCRALPRPRRVLRRPQAVILHRC